MGRSLLLLAVWAAACSSNSPEAPAPVPAAVPLAIGQGEMTVTATADGVVAEDVTATTDEGVTARVRAGTKLRHRDGSPIAGTITVGIREPDAADYTAHPDIEAVVELFASVADIVFDPPVVIEVDLSEDGSWSTFGFADHPPYERGTNAASTVPDPGTGPDVPLDPITDGTFAIDTPRVVGIAHTPLPRDPGLDAEFQTEEWSRTASAVFEVEDGSQIHSIDVIDRGTGRSVAGASFSAGPLDAGTTQRFGYDYELRSQDNANGTWTITLASNFHNVFDLRVTFRAPDASLTQQTRAADGGCPLENCVGETMYAGRVLVHFSDIEDLVHAFEVFADLQAVLPLWALAEFVVFDGEESRLIVRLPNWSFSVQRLVGELPSGWPTTFTERRVDISAAPPVDNPIAYMRSHVDEDGFELVVAQTGGGETLLVELQEVVSAPVWSPQGDAVAYRSVADDGMVQLFVVTYPGGVRRQVSSSPRAVSAWAWHPDGQRLFYVAAHATTPNQFVVRSTDRDGNDSELVVPPSGAVNSIGVTGDGDHVLFNLDGVIHAALVETGSAAPPIVEDAAVTQRGNIVGAPAGEQFAYMGIFEGESHVFVSSVTGGADTSLSDGPAFSPAWSPDGLWIAFSAEDGIYIVRHDGTQRRRVTTSAAGLEFGDGYPQFSPDGEWIVFTRIHAVELQDFGLAPSVDLFKVRVDGTELTPIVAPDPFVDRGVADW